MAITAGSSVYYFGGSQELTDLSASAIAASAMSVSTNITAWLNSANASHAYFYLSAKWNATPTVNLPVDLCGQRLNIVGTNDEQGPSIAYPSGYLGSFRCEATVTQSLGVFVELPPGKDQQEWQFWLLNRSGGGISKGYALHVNPVAFGPKTS